LGGSGVLTAIQKYHILFIRNIWTQWIGCWLVVKPYILDGCSARFNFCC